MSESIEKLFVDNKKPIYETKNRSFGKEKFKLELFSIIQKYISKNNFINNQNILSEKLKDNILYNISKLNIKRNDVTEFSVYRNGIIKFKTNKNGKEKIYSFNLNQNLEELEQNPLKNIYLGNREKLKQDKEKDIKYTLKNIKKTNNILDAMDYIFQENEKEWFDHLDKSDRLRTDIFGNNLVGNNLPELQVEFKKYFDKIGNIPKENLTSELVIEITKQETRYLKMVMGLGDKYEGGATLLKEKESTFERMAENIVNFSGNNNVMIYKLLDFHKEVDDNDYQSESVKKSYAQTFKYLHKKIYEKFATADNLDEANIIKFAKIITGKESDIDDDLRDPDLAQDILILLMNKEGGAIDNLTKSGELNIDDIEVKNKNPKLIIDDVRDKFYLRYGKNLESQKLFNKNLKSAGYDDILNIGKDKKYEDLDFYQKNKISVLYRVAKKMEEGKTFGERLKERVGNLFAGNISNTININNNYILQDFAGLFNLVAVDYIEQVANNLDDSFTDYGGLSAKSAEEIGLKKGSYQAQAFEVFQDIRGAGLIDFSDQTWSIAKYTGKFAGILGIAMIAPALLPVGASLITQGAVAGAAASISGMAIYPKGYDSMSEAVTDVTTDIALGTVTGGIGGGVAGRYGGKKFLSKQFYRNDKFIMASDLTFLGLGPEIARINWINGIYNNHNILEKEDK